MSWDERLFGRLFARLRQRRDQDAAARGAAVAPERRRLELLASALAGRRMTITIAAGDGGVRGAHLVLPARLDALATPEANTALLLARVAVGAIMARAPTPAARDDAACAVATLAALARARRAIADELPGAGALLAEVLPPLRAARSRLTPRTAADRALEAAAQLALGRPLAELAPSPPDLAAWLAAIAAGDPAVGPGPGAGGRLVVVPLCGWLGGPGLDDADLPTPGAEPRPGAGGREHAGRARDRLKRRQLDPQTLEENPLVHSFEKVHTLEKYQGGKKRIDGADELAAHGDALDELELDEVVRTSTTTSGVYRAEVLGLDDAGDLAAATPAPAPGALAYDEWDEAARRYRRGWCQVRVDAAPTAAAPERTRRFVATALARHRRERAELAAQVARLDAQPTRVGRQADGPDIDVDAVVDRHGALRHGSTGPDKLYVAPRRRPPELAVALLLDRSLSSDAWVADQRVLDVGTGALVALGDALERVAARTAIVAFASHTRRDCRLAMLKDFDAPWATAHARLAALEPAGYTRIGPALRHVTALLDRQPARRKLLVLLSDGKPTDYDRYEGRYGIADVHRAVAEATQAGVHVFTVALDQRARHHLPQMFGPGGFAVVTRPRDLVAAVGRLYQQRLTR
ncbi:MAG: VWA domain-containing protein [Myxococcales bacterium]|nr:VWA domain-containing protein [Myxococcales bacterium]